MCAEAVGHFRCVCPANYRIDEDTYASCKGIVLIGASVSKPHTSEVNCQFSHILSGIRRSIYS